MSLAIDTRAPFRLGMPEVTPAFRFTGTLEPGESLTERYRPATLSEIVGQGPPSMPWKPSWTPLVRKRFCSLVQPESARRRLPWRWPMTLA